MEIQVAVHKADVKPDGAGPILGDQHTWQVFDTGVSARGTGPKLLALEGKKWKVGSCSTMKIKTQSQSGVESMLKHLDIEEKRTNQPQSLEPVVKGSFPWIEKEYKGKRY